MQKFLAYLYPSLPRSPRPPKKRRQNIQFRRYRTRLGSKHIRQCYLDPAHRQDRPVCLVYVPDSFSRFEYTPHHRRHRARGLSYSFGTIFGLNFFFFKFIR